MNNWNPNPQNPNIQYIPPAPKPPKKRTGFWIVGLIGAFVLGLGLGATLNSTPAQDTVANSQPSTTTSVEPKAAPSTKPTRAPHTPPTKKWGNGTYEVGSSSSDMKPGRYKSSGGDLCYWARLSSLDGQFSSIIANSASTGPQVVVIKSTDKGFKTQSCGDWVAVK